MSLFADNVSKSGEGAVSAYETSIEFLRKLSLLDLPPEIRNMIYVHLLSSDDSQHNPRYPKSDAWEIVAAPYVEHASGVYTPFTSHALRDLNAELTADFRSSTDGLGYLWHADPAIWWVNRQIRTEALSLYVTRHMSVDVSGGDMTLAPNEQYRVTYVNGGLQLFNEWLKYRGASVLRKAMTRLELRDWVRIGLMVDEEHPTVRDWTNSRFCKLMTIYSISVSQNGDLLMVKTPLELHPDQVPPLEGVLRDIAGSVLARGRKVFDGDDILKCVHYLRESTEPAWSSEFSNTGLIGCEKLYRCEPEAIRWELLGREKEVDWEKGKLKVTGFSYVAASVRISEVKAFIMES